MSNKISTNDISPVLPFSSFGNFQDIVENCDQNIWEKTEYISEGKSGQVYVACVSNDCNYVMKIQKADAVFHNEVIALAELQKTGVVPKIYAAWTCKGKGYIIMEKLKSCSFETWSNSYTHLKHMLNILYNSGWLFVDIHKGNFLCKTKGNKDEIILIDFGWAVKKRSHGR